MTVARVNPDSLQAAFILSLVATAGFFYVNIMAAIVSGLIDGLHLSAQQAGRIGACNVYGAALGALGAVLLVRRIAWRAAAFTLLCGLIGLDLVSTLIHSVGWLTAVRLLHGVTGGLLVGISYGVIARTRSPDRCFGVLMVVQSSLGGLGLMFLPRLVPIFGTRVLFLALAAFSLTALAALPLLPAYPLKVSSQAPAGTRPRSSWSGGLLVALFAVFFFQAGNMALSAYIIELGRAYGLGLQFISTTIGLSGWVATLGALLVVALADKWKRAPPIAIGIVLAVLGNAALQGSAMPWVYLAANIVSAIMWFFVIPYLLGLCAAFDGGGRAASLAGLFSKLGLASGPYCASLLVGHDATYHAVIQWSVAALIVAGVCGVAAARIIDHRLNPLPALAG